MRIAAVCAFTLCVSFSYAQNVVSPKTKTQNFSQQLKGRFILEGAQCAGFEFINAKEIIWRNEVTCMEPDTFHMYWVDEKSFLVKDKKSPTGKQNVPPRNWFYTVKSFDGKQLTLSELWTGWGPFKMETQKYLKAVK